MRLFFKKIKDLRCLQKDMRCLQKDGYKKKGDRLLKKETPGPKKNMEWHNVE